MEKSAKIALVIGKNKRDNSKSVMHVSQTCLEESLNFAKILEMKSLTIFLRIRKVNEILTRWKDGGCGKIPHDVIKLYKFDENFP